VGGRRRYCCSCCWGGGAAGAVAAGVAATTGAATTPAPAIAAPLVHLPSLSPSFICPRSRSRLRSSVLALAFGCPLLLCAGPPSRCWLCALAARSSRMRSAGGGLLGVGGVARKEQRWLWSRAFINASGGRVGGQKSETEPPRLGFGSAVSNSAGESWWVLVGLLERSDGGRGAARSQMRVGERGWESKTRNWPRRLSFGL
jgi:hypothetical protein